MTRVFFSVVVLCFTPLAVWFALRIRRKVRRRSSDSDDPFGFRVAVAFDFFLLVLVIATIAFSALRATFP